MTPSTQPGLLRTVTGSIPVSDVTGSVLCHEHLQLDLRWPQRRLTEVPSDPRRWLDEEQAVTAELGGLRTGHGLSLVVDLTCQGMGRNAAMLSRISAGARVAVVAGTGFFTEPFAPQETAGADEDRLAELLLAEIGFGMDGTSSLPGVIGEIGCWGPAPTAAEERALRAAALAAQESGLAVATYGRAGMTLLEILTSAGLPAERVAVGGQDLVNDPGAHRKIAETGAYVAFGTVGLAGEDHTALGARVRHVLELLETGHGERILLSTGVSRMVQIRRYGGAGYGYLFEVFLPALRAAGVDEAALRTILHDNPLRWLTGGTG
ncbi:MULTISPECIES: phosphotriesterase family protein [Thermomonospora]|uniref:Phosphotriesterase-related protein n=1 Tax=Thermomonospora cellulosilytica TaxID=1411118 RepID=A0A7W3R8T5_9ACTN|nr:MULTISPECIES: aryldialkylphosphatase [Thermomonospora]MBA9004648.1 phosphotriesterase-related protein [Thermomonospora cellulosilytica]